MQEFLTFLKKHPVVYVTRDIERAMGLSFDTPGYFIISNSTPFAKFISQGRKNILLIESEHLLPTFDLLQREETESFLKNIASNGPNPSLLVFKPTSQIERICTQNTWKLLNPLVSLSSTIEEKISQIDWLGPLEYLLPPHCVDTLENLDFEIPFILQFNTSHTGTGTQCISDIKQLNALKQTFPKRPVRALKYISGPTFTSNNVVSKENIFLGNISYQITGISPFTNNPFATIGNDFDFANRFLTDTQKQKFFDIAKKVGEKLQQDGWLGAYGIDVIVDKETQELYLLEVNARQPASVPFESLLQKEKTSLEMPLTIFEAHLMSLLDFSIPYQSIIPLTKGAQIILRDAEIHFDAQKLLSWKNQLESLGYTVIDTPNTEDGTELLRIRTKHGSFISHEEKLNDEGERIKKIFE
ncbi:MAG: hypothetical protein COV59_02335 [Candidatus Magasanikbacteria bacterium CG11_big_fil_rev_8_21_14_0_20_39_34]|uniref:ATP-grasp domain-containing protein n=1 Tax=Candidatus Magasanikbacteria bacterium CG11_big_fil_rev_8_21_14_0_20_39_34 TaxID=1974653 RepID=A0A2H0N516_9BACT|nr:MAG: hypothetical protein COV59_02335 [Candidatus Magasanikbacteria bacterium CG11_big_fil_rev_8_21_14_0_20_39_34]